MPPTEPEPFEVARLPRPAKYAIVETVVDARRILCLMDDKAEATQMARELRRHGVVATACRTVTRG
ncbi:MAG: hypothetical protein ABSE77_13725 [Acidimicrobiales bacterium]